MTRRILLSLIAVALLAGGGALLLDRVVEPDDTGVATGAGTTAVAPGSTEDSDPEAFPDAIPRTGDDECSVPRTDPDRPAIEETGEPTDGIEITEVTISDGDEGEVAFTAVVSDAPVVAAASGSRWVVIELLGVRRAIDAATVETRHARVEPANVCDDAAWAYAFSFDAPVTGLELQTLDDTTVEIVIRLA